MCLCLCIYHLLDRFLFHSVHCRIQTFQIRRSARQISSFLFSFLSSFVKQHGRFGTNRSTRQAFIYSAKSSESIELSSLLVDFRSRSRPSSHSRNQHSTGRLCLWEKADTPPLGRVKDVCPGFFLPRERFIRKVLPQAMIEWREDKATNWSGIDFHWLAAAYCIEGREGEDSSRWILIGLCCFSIGW